jgi:hypothetical protein
MSEEHNSIQSSEDFDGPDADQKRWSTEVRASKKHVEDWHERARKIIDRFIDKRDTTQPQNNTRVNLFTSNIQTRRATMYGRVPQCEVVRRYADPNDVVARVAAQMLTRLLNLDIEKETDDYATAVGLALDDLQLAGLGVARVRYEAEFETQPAQPAQIDPVTGLELAPEVPEQEVKVEEKVPVDYVHWRDLLWSPSRTWHEVRWVGFRTYLTREKFKERFGEEHLANVAAGRKPREREDGLKHDPWERVEVWEIWSKEDRKVYWFAEGAHNILDQEDDPLELDGFFPVPRPMASNLTTDSFMPVPDFTLAQDIYDEIDFVSTRIQRLERAVKVVGVYDATAEPVKRMLSEATDNELIPVESWALWAERGGMKGSVDWLPLDQVVGALDKLREYRTELIQLLYEVTGMSDIVRGSSDADETATAQAIKAKFAGTRMQAAQDEFARFATDLLRLRAEIIVKLCDDEYIVDGANVANTPDAPYVGEAVALLRDQRLKFRVEIKPEHIAATDWQELQSERTSILQAFTGFLQAAAPLMMQQPASAPFLLDILKWSIAGFRGSSSIEAVIDQAISQAKEALANPPPPQPDPKLEGIKAQVEADKVKAQLDVETATAKHQIDKQKLGVDLVRAQLDIAKEMAGMRAEAMKDATGGGHQ